MAQTQNEELTPEEAVERAQRNFEEFLRFPIPTCWARFVRCDATIAAAFDETTSRRSPQLLLSKEAFQLYHECGYLRRFSNPTQLWAVILWCWADHACRDNYYLGERGGKCIIEVFQYLIDLGFAIPPSWTMEGVTVMQSVTLCKYLVSIGISLSTREWTKLMGYVQARVWCNYDEPMRDFVTQMIPVFLENGFVPTPQNTPMVVREFDVARIKFIHQTFGFPVPPLNADPDRNDMCVVFIPQDAQYYDFFEHAYGIRLSPEDGDVFSTHLGWVVKGYGIPLNP